MRVAIVFYCLAVALLLFLVSNREEISHECMEARGHRAPKTPPPESSRANGTNTHSVKGSSA
jgi:hypothetical protein